MQHAHSFCSMPTHSAACPLTLQHAHSFCGMPTHSAACPLILCHVLPASACAGVKGDYIASYPIPRTTTTEHITSPHLPAPPAHATTTSTSSLLHLPLIPRTSSPPAAVVPHQVQDHDQNPWPKSRASGSLSPTPPAPIPGPGPGRWVAPKLVCSGPGTPPLLSSCLLSPVALWALSSSLPAGTCFPAG